eukprot:1180772-Prorocentrum_minimum.AAC.2
MRVSNQQPMVLLKLAQAQRGIIDVAFIRNVVRPTKVAVLRRCIVWGWGSVPPRSQSEDQLGGSGPPMT